MPRWGAWFDRPVYVTGPVWLTVRSAILEDRLASRGNPPSPEPPAWTPRRSQGGARSELTERVTVRAPGFEAHGWTLNVSRGGLRAIIEERLSPGVEYEVVVGEEPAGRAATLVWSKDESDGQIVGMKYVDAEESLPPFDEPKE